MSQNKNNTIENFTDRFADGVNDFSQNMAIGMMATATVLGLVEVGLHENTKHAIVASAPIIATAEHAAEPNELRRERIEETHPHGSNSSATQRTPSRAGKA